jgi:hypothetical protein
MGWNDHMDDGADLSNLPPEAFGNVFDVDGPFDPNDSWLQNADRDDQVTALRAWFLARYCDPSMETPYMGREGGFIYVNGGPFHPDEELWQRFSRVVPQGVIEEVVEELRREVGDDWAPIEHVQPDYDYDERLEPDLPEATTPLYRLKERLANAMEVLELAGQESARKLALQLVFGAHISALESFLWETAHYWAATDPEVVRNIISRLPMFEEQRIPMSSIFKKMDAVDDIVKGLLQKMVWHRWKDVASLYALGLEVKLPDTSALEAAVVKRHDIVHRSGHTVEGEPVEITRADVDALAAEVSKFCHDVTRLLDNRSEF